MSRIYLGELEELVLLMVALFEQGGLWCFHCRELQKHHGPGDHDQCDPRGVTQTGREGIRDLANGRRFGKSGVKKKAAVQHHGLWTASHRGTSRYTRGYLEHDHPGIRRMKYIPEPPSWIDALVDRLAPDRFAEEIREICMKCIPRISTSVAFAQHAGGMP